MQRPVPQAAWAYAAGADSTTETYCYISEGGFIKCGNMKPPHGPATTWAATLAPVTGGFVQIACTPRGCCALHRQTGVTCWSASH